MDGGEQWEDCFHLVGGHPSRSIASICFIPIRGENAPVFRILRRLFVLAVAAAMAGAVVYSFTDHFSQRWRSFVIAQFEERGVHIDFERFGLGLADGLSAREVRVYRDRTHRQVLMTMNRLNLDVDYGRLMKRQFFVEGLELLNAAVSLPLDPEDPKQGTLDLTRFSARAFLMDDRLDIRRAEADLAGLHLVLSGSLQLPEKGKPGAREKKEGVRKKLVDLKVVRNQRAHIQQALKWLTRFEFQKRPVITFEITGNVESPEELRAQLRFEATGVRHDTYVCDELRATAEYHDHLLDIREVTMRDDIGTFEASATWPVGGDEVDFRVNTTANLPQLAQSFFQSDELKEVVFYKSSSPSLSLEGKWFVGGPNAGPKRPVEATGKVKFGMFTTRGEVFDGLTASFGVTPGGYYIRDAMLRHKSGTLSLQAMLQQLEGFKYRAVLKMDPHAFLPFASAEAARDWIQRFEFSENSTIYADITGSGSDASLAACLNRGRIDLREFKFRGIEFESWTGDVEFFNRKQIFRNVLLIPRHGRAAADEVLVDLDSRSVRLTKVRGKLDPIPVTSCFARTTAEALAKYRFGPDTEVELDGVIGFAAQTLTDFTIEFNSPAAPVTYPLFQRDLAIHGAAGKFVIKNGNLGYSVAGRLFGGPMQATGNVTLGVGNKGFNVNLQAAEFRHSVLGKDLPLRDLKAAIISTSERTPYDITATVLGGSMTLKGELESHDLFDGELQVSGIDFQEFATLYAPGNESEGDITGHFNCSGQLGNWKRLKGEGVMIIVNGNLYAIPVLGPLTPLLGSVLPGQIKGYNVAREANCNFSVADGVITTTDFEALTSAFRIVASGTANFIDDEIDFTAQARVRGLPGLVLRPVSELLEFKGEGSLAKPAWRPHYLSLAPEKPARTGKMDDPNASSPPPDPEKPIVAPLGRPGR